MRPNPLKAETAGSGLQIGVETRTTLSKLLDTFTIEATPAEIAKGKDGLQELPKGTSVYIPRLPKNDFDATLDAARSLQAMGLHPVPHITARTTDDRKQLLSQLQRLIRDAGIDEILLLAGGDETPVGAFDSSLEILESGVLEEACIARIGVAGHPEGHPDVDAESLLQALITKQAFSARTGIPIHIVTQFFFEAPPVIAWEKSLRAHGVTMPVHVGLHGVGSTASLLKHAIECGIGASIRVLRNQSLQIRNLIGPRDPGGLLEAIATAASDPNSLFRTCHFFPLGAFDQTVRWINHKRGGPGSPDQ